MRERIKCEINARIVDTQAGEKPVIARYSAPAGSKHSQLHPPARSVVLYWDNRGTFQHRAVHGTPAPVLRRSGVLPRFGNSSQNDTRRENSLREAVDRAREAYHEALRRFDQTPKDERTRDAAWGAVRVAMKRYHRDG